MKKHTSGQRTRLVIGLMLFAVVAVAATINGTNGDFTTSVSSGTITTTYTPTAADPTCNSIYMVQTCRDEDQAGNLVKPKDFVGSGFDHLQDDMTPGGTYVDHIVCEKDPYYNGEDEDKDAKSEGSNDGTDVTPTTMSDTPSYGDGIFPAGVSKIVSTFEVCAICKDNGTILDCFTWTYTRTKGDGTTGTVVSGTAATTATTEFKAAKKKFEKTHKDGTICPETVAENNAGEGNVTSGGGKKVPENPQPLVPFLLNWDVVNTSGVDLFNVEFMVFVDGDPVGNGMIPELPYFDFETILVEMPPLPQGPHQITVLIDPNDQILEYDETDNMGYDEFFINETSAVPDEAAETGLFMRMLLPNPTHGEFQVMLRLGSDAPAHLQVIDVRGRVVQSRTIQGASDMMRTEQFHLSGELGGGVYFLRLKQGTMVQIRKFVLLN